MTCTSATELIRRAVSHEEGSSPLSVPLRRFRDVMYEREGKHAINADDCEIRSEENSPRVAERTDEQIFRVRRRYR